MRLTKLALLNAISIAATPSFDFTRDIASPDYTEIPNNPAPKHRTGAAAQKRASKKRKNKR